MTTVTVILRRDEVLSRVGISQATLYRWMKTQGFPRPKKLGPRAVGWVKFEVDAWLDSRERVLSEGE